MNTWFLADTQFLNHIAQIEMKNLRYLILLLILLGTSAQAQTKKEKKKMKAQEEEKLFAETKELIESGTYEFYADWANSFQGRRINLVTNPNHLKMNQEEASVYLPYYGVAHNSSPAYSNMGAMEFKGTVENYEVKVNEKKRQMIVTFRCRAKREVLDMSLTVFADGNSRLNSNSSVRTGVNYDGRTTAPAPEE